MGDAPDYARLAEEVLGLKNVPAALARRLVAQGLVVDDRQEAWRRAGARICGSAPQTPGVYRLLDAERCPLYVGKAVNLRRRLRAHFAPARWRRLSPVMARVDAAEWQEVGSELESLLVEAQWIADLRPPGNVQVGPPRLTTRDVPQARVKDTIALLPSVEPDSVELVAALARGGVLVQRTRRNGRDLAVHAARLWRFGRGRAASGGALAAAAPLVFSWLDHRGAAVTRVEYAAVSSARDLQRVLATALAHRDLLGERIVVL